MSSGRSGVTGFLRPGTGRKRLLFEASVLLCLSLLLVRLVPFRRWSGHLGMPTEPAGEATRTEHVELLREVARAVDRVNRAAGGRFTCLMQAVTGKLMLNRRRIGNTLVLGVRTVPRERGVEIAAHAWLSSGAIIVLGGEGHTQYTVVSRHYSDRPGLRDRSA